MKPPVQRNIAQLRADGMVIIGPETGHLSCGEVGAGRMAEPEVIFKVIAEQLAAMTKTGMRMTLEMTMTNDESSPASFIRHSSSVIRHSSMPRILLTSGPTRQYLDPVRYLSNGSSGRMGKALAEAALEAGHEVVIVSGPVEVRYPRAARVLPVISTEEMLDACLDVFPECDGLIAAAAPCDYRPKVVASQKIRKTGGTLDVQFVETPDIVARLGAIKTSQWMVAFALETEDLRMRAMQKLERKKCDLIVVNGPAAMHAADTTGRSDRRPGRGRRCGGGEQAAGCQGHPAGHRDAADARQLTVGGRFGY